MSKGPPVVRYIEKVTEVVEKEDEKQNGKKGGNGIGRKQGTEHKDKIIVG